VRNKEGQQVSDVPCTMMMMKIQIIIPSKPCDVMHMKTDDDANYNNDDDDDDKKNDNDDVYEDIDDVLCELGI
jgi:hypothetical protein